MSYGQSWVHSKLIHFFHLQMCRVQAIKLKCQIMIINEKLKMPLIFDVEFHDDIWRAKELKPMALFVRMQLQPFEKQQQ